MSTHHQTPKTPSLHILFVTPAYPPSLGGGERYADALAQALVKRGHHLTVVTSTAVQEQDFWQFNPSLPQQPVSEQLSDQLTIIRCPLRPLTLPLLSGQAALMGWRKAMILLDMLPGQRADLLGRMAAYVPAIEGLPEVFTDLDKVDIVHGFNISWEHTLVAGWRYAQTQQRPFVMTPFAHFGTGHHDRIVRNMTMTHQLRMLRQAAAVLTLTSIEAHDLTYWGVSAERAISIGGGVEAAEVVDEEEVDLAAYQLTQPYVLFVGRMNRDKGALDTAAAVLRLRAAGLPITLALIGGGTAEFDHYYQRLSATEQEGIRYLGSLDDKAKNQLLRQACCLALPSRADSFGIVLLEAWAQKTAVIGATAGGIPGVVDEGQNGLLVDYGDVDGLAEAIRQLVTDASLRERLGAAGFDKVHRYYQWEQVAERVEGVYQQLLLDGRLAADMS